MFMSVTERQDLCGVRNYYVGYNLFILPVFKMVRSEGKPRFKKNK